MGRQGALNASGSSIADRRALAGVTPRGRARRGGPLETPARGQARFPLTLGGKERLKMPETSQFGDIDPGCPCTLTDHPVADARASIGCAQYGKASKALKTKFVNATQDDHVARDG